MAGRVYEDGEGDGPEEWMDGWTIFYWGWWISWSPFVGMFIAKISRGRTIRQFINGKTLWESIICVELLDDNIVVEIRKLKDPEDATIYKLNWVKQC